MKTLELRDDGGPAFPVVASTGDPRDGVYCRDGMSLRDYLAAHETLLDWAHPSVQMPEEMRKKLAGYDMPQDGVEYLHWEAAWMSALKYIRADAMIRARERVTGGAK